jgi:hypothetical protein
VRFYESFGEVMSEVERDLKELAIVYQSENVQDMDVSGDPGYLTHELINYSYSLTDPRGLIDTDSGMYQYILAEHEERMRGAGANPGTAWYLDREYWEPFLHNGKFSYTYSERLYRVAELAVLHLTEMPTSRQAWIPIWRQDDITKAGKERVPCSLGYHLMIRNDRLYLHYIMRSCDFNKHFKKDVILATMFQEDIAKALEREVGTFTHTIFSLHAFAKDLEGVF